MAININVGMKKNCAINQFLDRRHYFINNKSRFDTVLFCLLKIELFQFIVNNRRSIVFIDIVSDYIVVYLLHSRSVHHVIDPSILLLLFPPPLPSSNSFSLLFYIIACKPSLLKVYGNEYFLCSFIFAIWIEIEISKYLFNFREKSVRIQRYLDKRIEITERRM